MCENVTIIDNNVLVSFEMWLFLSTLQETASAELAGLEGVAPARSVALASKLSLLVPEDSTIISMDTELLN